MGDIININSIHDYNEFLGIETLNPLVTFIDFKDVKVLKHKKKLYGFYGIYLKEKIHGKLTYGRSQYQPIRLSGRHVGIRGSRTSGRY